MFLHLLYDQLRGWWRGESEGFVQRERERAFNEWNDNIETARQHARSFKVKSMINRKVLRRMTEKMTLAPEDADLAYESASRNMGGDGWDLWRQRRSADNIVRKTAITNEKHILTQE